MFDVIYIEKSLQKIKSNREGTRFSWMEKILEQSPCGRIEYVEVDELEDRTNTEALSEVRSMETVAGKRAKKTGEKELLIGETKQFLTKGQNLKIPVLAVLNDREDLFSFPYAVCALSDVTLDYLELIQCRYEKRPYKIAETHRLYIVEMNEENAIEYFRLKEAEPALFLQDVEATAKSEQEIEECAHAYISRAYPFYGYGIWAVYEKETGSLIGFAGVDRQGEEKHYLNLSYYIKGPFRNKGYATECCREIVRYMREEYGEEQLCCVIEENNQASLAVAEKLDVEIRKI